MAEIVYIDARHKLGPNAIQQFKSEQSDDALVTMFIEDNEFMCEKSLSNLRQFFEDEEVESMVPDDKCVIHFMTDMKVLTIIGLDYNWWIAPIRGKKYGRLKRLFDDEVQPIVEKEQKPRQSRQVETHKCVVAKPGGENLGVIEEFEGKMKDLINFVNKHRQLDLLKTFFKSDLQYSFDDGPFKTFEQHTADGTFVLTNEEAQS